MAIFCGTGLMTRSRTRVETTVKGSSVKKNNLERGKQYFFQVLPVFNPEDTTWAWSTSSKALTPGVIVHQPSFKRSFEAEESEGEEEFSDFVPPTCLTMCQSAILKAFKLTTRHLENASWLTMDWVGNAKMYIVVECHELARDIHGGDKGIARALAGIWKHDKKRRWSTL